MDACHDRVETGNLTGSRATRTTTPMHLPPPRSTIRNAGLVAAQLIAFALVSVATGCQRESAEEALRSDIASLQAAIESRDAGEVAEFLAADFVGNDGLDRDGARRLAALHFMRNAGIGVTTGPLDVEVQGDHATVRTTVVLTGRSGGILPDTGRIRDVTAGWRREGGDWRMTSLGWESR